MARPRVQEARREAKAAARMVPGANRQSVRQAGRQGAQQMRQNIRTARQTPQPPSQPSPGTETQGGGGTPGYYEYQPSAESQLNQPYQDMIAGGAMQSLGDVMGRMGQQGQMGDIYAKGAAQNFGGAQQGMGQLAPLGGGYMGQSGQNLGMYGGLQNPNYAIQQNLANAIQNIQTGRDAGFDPLLAQQLGDQERLMNEQMRRQVGGDWQNSSAGIEAQGKFNQLKQTTLGTSRFNQLQGLLNQQQAGIGNLANQGLGFGQFGAGVQGQQFGQGAQLGQMFGANATDLYNQAMGLRNQQLGGAGQLINQAGAMQNLYNNIPQTMAQYGQMMSGQAGAAVGAQQPYQKDRFLNAQLSYAPTQGQYAGQMMGQSGDRWIQAANSMGGAGGGGGGMGGGVPEGYGNPSTFNPYGAQFQ